jgi:hypothetical protein
VHSRLVSLLIATSVALAAPVAAQETAVPVDTSHSALIRMMKADLRVLVQQQQHYFALHQTYADSLSSLAQVAPVSGGVVRILSAGRQGWSGTLTVEGVSCGVFVGTAVAPNAAVWMKDEPGCWFRGRDGIMVGV